MRVLAATINRVSERWKVGLEAVICPGVSTVRIPALIDGDDDNSHESRSP